MSVKPLCLLLALCFTFTAAGTGFEWTLDSSDWRFSNRNASIVGKARVPGGVFSDLRASGIINEDPLRRYNDVAYRWVSEDDWTYAVTFNVNSSSVKLFNKQYIIFNGVDTISDVYLNKKLIGSTNNMFVKYTFSVKEYLNEGENFLEVIINSSVRVANNKFKNSLNKIPPFCVPKEYNGECHINYLRKMQSSFGWDWGPAFPSVGIWKSVKLVMFQEHALEYIKTETIPVNASHWLLKTDVYVKCFGSISDAKIKLTLNTKKNMLRKEQDCCNEICIQNEMHTTIELYISMIDVNTWWPNGYGEQPLYNLSIEFITKYDFQLKIISIGFRTAELIQELIDKNDPKMGLSFYLKVNGVPIFAKGTNYIPADIFPEKSNDERAISYLLSSAKRAHMNTIRVWGGGVYESDGFYKICDQLGIMIWQDMMFACNMYPANEHFLETVGVEIKQQIRRLQHHPSIVIWAGNNENEAALRGNWYGTRTNYSSFVSDYIALYVNTVKKIVSEEDTTRTYLVSSPTNGLKSEEENYIAENPYSALYGDVHYYNYEVNSWSTIFFPWTRFASEYGFQSLPAYQTLQNAFDEIDLINFPSPALIHRQHLPLGYMFMLYQIEINLPVPPKPTVSDYVYLSQVVQARAIRIQTEWYRKHRNTLLKDGRGLTMGALYWQLNDVWQAPTWSSIDYDQRWKMLHYSALDFFSPIIVVPELEISNNLTIYLVSDILVDLKVVLNVEVYNWECNIPLATYISDTILLKKNSAQFILNENYFNWLKVLTNKCGLIKDQQIRSCFLHTKLYYRNMTEASPSNYLFPTSFNKIIRHTPNISVSRIWQEKNNEVNVELESTGIGLFVWLNVTQIYGYFNENGFIMLNKTKTVIYRSNKDISLKQFNLNISHLRTNYTV